jgi:hypothetical protein
MIMASILLNLITPSDAGGFDIQLLFFDSDKYSSKAKLFGACLPHLHLLLAIVLYRISQRCDTPCAQTLGTSITGNFENIFTVQPIGVVGLESS